MSEGMRKKYFPPFQIPFAWLIALTEKAETEKSVIPFVIHLGAGTSSTLARPFCPPRKRRRQRKNKHLEINSRLWSTTKDKGCGELQDQKWKNMEKSSSVKVPCSQEEFKELVAAAQGCYGLGTGTARHWGQSYFQQGSPILFWFCFFLPVMWATSSAGARRKLMERLWRFAGLYSERLDVLHQKCCSKLGWESISEIVQAVVLD